MGGQGHAVMRLALRVLQGQRRCSMALFEGE
jgi:hypothetical protein